jgi:hypothetical protein
MTSITATPPQVVRRRLLPRAVRIGVGLLAGVGATGVAAGLAVLGRYIDIDLPLIDPSALFLMAPVLAIPFAATALLGGAAAVTWTVVGAVGAPIVASFAIEGGCESNMWVGFGLLVIAFYVLAIAGVAAFVGNFVGGPQTFKRHPTRWTVVLVAVSLVGIGGWIAFLAGVPRCP